MEANPHSFREDGNELGNTELILTRKLLASDLNGVVSCQGRLSLKSMVLITQRNRPPKGNTPFPGGNVAHGIPSSDPIKFAGPAGKKSLLKKVKRQHPLPNSSPLSSSTRNKRGASYFRNEHLLAQSYSVRDGINSEFASTIIGRIGLQCHLSDLVTNSFSLPLRPHQPCQEEAARQGRSSAHCRPPRNTRPVLLGTIPCIGEEVILRKRGSRSGIALPAGVKVPRSARKSTIVQVHEQSHSMQVSSTDPRGTFVGLVAKWAADGGGYCRPRGRWRFVEIQHGPSGRGRCWLVATRHGRPGRRRFVLICRGWRGRWRFVAI